MAHEYQNDEEGKALGKNISSDVAHRAISNKIKNGREKNSGAKEQNREHPLNVADNPQFNNGLPDEENSSPSKSKSTNPKQEKEGKQPVEKGKQGEQRNKTPENGNKNLESKNTSRQEVKNQSLNAGKKSAGKQAPKGKAKHGIADNIAEKANAARKRLKAASKLTKKATLKLKLMLAKYIVIFLAVFLLVGAIAYAFLTPGNIAMTVAKEYVHKKIDLVYTLRDIEIDLTLKLYYALNPFAESPTSDEGLQKRNIKVPEPGVDYDATITQEIAIQEEYRVLAVGLSNAYDKALDSIKDVCSDNGIDYGRTMQAIKERYPNGWNDVYENINYGQLMCICYFFIHRDGDDWEIGENQVEKFYQKYIAGKETLVDEQGEAQAAYTLSGLYLKAFYILLKMNPDKLIRIDVEEKPYIWQEKNLKGEEVINEGKYYEVTLQPYSLLQVFDMIDVEPTDEYDDNISYADMLPNMADQLHAILEHTDGTFSGLVNLLNLDNEYEVWDTVENSISVSTINTIVQGKINNQDNAETVWNYLMANNYSEFAACAIMGNLIGEGFSTAMSGDQGSVGIAQWRGGRKENLENYARDNGLEVTSIEAQAGFLIYELENGSARYHTEDIKNAKSLDEATDLVAYYYEACARYTSQQAYSYGRYSDPDGDLYISWSRFKWSDTMQIYILDLQKRRNGAVTVYNTFVKAEE